MKQQHSSTVATPSVHAAPKVRATPRRAGEVRSARTFESVDSRDRTIREVAYSFYEARGRCDGHELDDWFQAEAEVDRTLSADSVESIAASPFQP